MNLPTVSPAFAGLIKGVLIVIVAAVVSYFGNASNLNGIVSPIIATIIAGLFSSIESAMKANSSNTTALFGTVRIS